MDLQIAGKKALVTGASSGLGRGIAEALAAEGVHVNLAARRADRLADAVAGIQQKGGSAAAHTLDLSDLAQVEALASSLLAAGGIDILVANSGGPPPSGPQGVKTEVWREQFDGMILPIITLIDRLVPGMQEKGFGRVMIVSSSGVVQPIPTLAISNTLRSSLVGYAKTLAGAVAGDGVTVNLLAPGRIHTDRTDQLDKANADRTGKSIDDVRAASTATIPAGRYGKVEEFAATAAFLAGVPAGYITGSVIRIDGGMIRSV